VADDRTADDVAEIRDLIDTWARAVHGGDLDTVLAQHSGDIVMFDVPPPHQGVRGLAAYRDTWPPFFEWQRQGAVFEIESLDVTAGADVAFAYALLRCGTPEEFAEVPERRLRLTVGLRKDDGRWVVTHEHHSFAIT
jgi:uncharacterized protein (TIGR02246 family)